MSLRKTLLAAAVVLSVPVMPALAHDDESNGYNSHDRFHDQLSDAHERAHEYGFYSGAEHRAYHRALRDIHDDAPLLRLRLRLSRLVAAPERENRLDATNKEE